MTTNRRVLVTGSNGCVGAWTIRRVLEMGHSVTAMNYSTDRSRFVGLVPADQMDQVQWITADITEPGNVSKALSENAVEALIHLAAPQVPAVAANPIAGAMVNVIGSMRVFEAARSTGLGHLVYASSIAVFGPNAGYDPKTLYGAFKVTIELAAQVYFADHGLSSTGVRPWAVFGPGRDQGLTSAPTTAVRSAGRGENYVIPYTGLLKLDYVEDVANQIVASVLAPTVGATVFDTVGTIVDVGEFIQTLESVVPGASNLVTAEGKALPLPILDGTEGPEIERTSLVDAIRRTLHFYSS